MLPFANPAERSQVGRLFIVIIVRHCNEKRVFQACAPKHRSFQRASRPSIAIQEWMHRADVVVSRQRLDQRVMSAELAVNRFAQSGERLLAFIPSLRAAAPRRAEGHILIALSQSS